MKTFHLELILITILLMQRCHFKILRNNALMNKMVSHFQKDNPHNNLGLSLKRAERERQQMIEMEEKPWPTGRSPVETEERTDPRTDRQPERLGSHKHSKQPSESDSSLPARQPQASSPKKRERIINVMKRVLCKNFPGIPCNIIMQDEALNKLIERSIQQIIFKQLQNSDRSTVSPHGSTVFPVINSEDLSNFLEVSNTGYFEAKKKKKENKKSRKSSIKTRSHWSHEKNTKKTEKVKGNQDMKRNDLYSNGHKKMRKFYPHKIKYKDKKSGKNDYSDERLSISVEVPDMKISKKGPKTEMKDNMAYKVESEDQPIWRIDYMKHGMPSMNMFGYEDDRLSGKLIKPGPNVMLDENRIEQSSVGRKEILHPDVYIKKNFARKSSVNFNSEGLD